MIVVSDTTAITNFYQVDLLKLMKTLFQEIIIPQSVYDELAIIPKQKNVIDNCSWIKIKKVKNKKMLAKLSIKLDSGEAEAIVLAKELKADLIIIDEYLGRKVAKEQGLKIIGVLGILIIAKNNGNIAKILPIVDELIQKAKFRVNPKLLNKILKKVGE